MEDNNEMHMKKACDLASHSVSIGGGPFGAVIVDKNMNIVGKGHNMVTINNDPTQHAEIVAIRNACNNLNTYNLDGCTLYTSCEPCPMCLGAVYWSRINKIYYGNSRVDAKNIGFDDNFIYEEFNKNLDERVIPIIQCYEVYAKNSFEDWMKKDDKTEY
jgi:tRNA(Arg) A34 adenosine deaminase TadA